MRDGARAVHGCRVHRAHRERVAGAPLVREIEAGHALGRVEQHEAGRGERDAIGARPDIRPLAEGGDGEAARAGRGVEGGDPVHRRHEVERALALRGDEAEAGGQARQLDRKSVV